MRALALVFVIVAFCACSVERLPVPSTPPAQTTSPAPSDADAAPSGLRPAVEDRFIAAHAPGPEVLVGTLATGWRRLGVDYDDSTVVNVWGRIVLTRREGDEIVVSILDNPDEAPREAYRAVSVVGDSASISRDGSRLVLYGGGIGTRVIDLRSGAETDFLPAAGGLGPLVLHWSPDGRSFYTGECDTSTCWSRVIELDSLRVTEISDLVPMALGGGRLVGYRNEGDRDVLMLDLASGERRPVAAVIDEVYSAMALSETRFLVYGGMAGNHYGFVLIDTESGTDAHVASDPLLRFPVEEFVDPDWVVLQPRDPSTVRVDAGSSLDVLDLASGQIIEGVIAVPPAP